MAAHPFVHVEISATDPATAARFYEEVFGWKIQRDESFDYYMFAAEGGPGGGFVKPDGAQYKPGDVVVYIDSNDIDATLKQIEARGGRTLLPKTEIPGIGWFAFFADPTGNRLALYTDLHPH